MPAFLLEGARMTPASASTIALSGTQTMDVRDPRFGARCDWNGRSGTDDTAAFHAAAAAASAVYQRTGKTVNLRIGKACQISSTVYFGSGVHWEGPGTLYVPLQRDGILRARNADDVAVSGIAIEVLDQACGKNNAKCSAISWESTAEDGKAHAHVTISHNTIRHSNWGVLVGYAAGRGSLSDVDITDNRVESPHAYMDADGIHVGGRVRDFLIKRNTVSNRGDAGIAASSEVPDFVCSNGVIEDNVLLEDQVGLDNSGCTHTLWQANLVRAVTAPFGSNPAFRSITYLGMRSSYVTVTGNYLQNAPGKEEFAMKVDEDARRGEQNIILQGNTISSPLALYLRGSGIRVDGNVFAARDSRVTIDYDGPRRVPTGSIDFGANRWLGSGVIRSGDNPALLTHITMAPQSLTASVSYSGLAHPANEGAASPRGAAGLSSERASEQVSGQHILQVPNSAARGSVMHAGDCSSLQLRAPQARPSMSVAGTKGELENNPAGISWAFVSKEGVVTVKSCTLADGASIRWPRLWALG
jgi:hypothetical protein